MITASKWQPRRNGAALRGFVDLEELQPSGLGLCGCALMASNGKRWIGLTGKLQRNRDYRPLKSLQTGKDPWSARFRSLTGRAESCSRPKLSRPSTRCSNEGPA
jgi:hypothetical protein